MDLSEFELVRSKLQFHLVERIRNTEFFRPICPDLYNVMSPELYVGRSASIVDKFCGPGGKLEKRLEEPSTMLRSCRKQFCHSWYSSLSSSDESSPP